VHGLPFNKLKIDRSFINNIESNQKSQDIVRALVTLCHDLGLACIIEGVETLNQLKMVEKLGGATIQGYYFSRPMPAEAVASYLESRS
jgi:EAL domain-containing protein (putative c-di-GMP-specific phosphodiesterase class I)